MDGEPAAAIADEPRPEATDELLDEPLAVLADELMEEVVAALIAMLVAVLELVTTPPRSPLPEALPDGNN